MKSSISTNRHQTESGAGLRVIIPKGILVTYKSGIGITKKKTSVHPILARHPNEEREEGKQHVSKGQTEQSDLGEGRQPEFSQSPRVHFITHPRTREQKNEEIL